MFMNMTLAEYLRLLYKDNCTNVNFVRHVQPLYGKMGYRPEEHKILINGLIGMAFGSYLLYDPKLMKLADETIEKYSPLI